MGEKWENLVPLDLTKHATDESEHIFSRLLQISVITDKLISYLSFTDLRTCRLVCHKWNTICSKYFIKSSVCSIKNSPKKRALVRFLATFPTSNLFPCTDFRLEGEFSAVHLEEFFNKWTSIQKLTLERLNITDHAGRSIKTYNIGKWNKLQELSELTVQNSINFPLLVPTRLIASIKKLFLRGVIILLNWKIAPIKLELVICEFRIIPNVSYPNYRFYLNRCIDVSNLVELRISRLRVQECHLDLKDCLKLCHLSVEGGILSGWHEHLRIRRLEIADVRLDVSSLPPSVEDLRFIFSPSTNEYLQHTAEKRFPHLRSLGICDKNSALFALCPNLSRVVTIPEGTLNLDKLPASVRKVTHLSDSKIVGFRGLPLETLVVDERSLPTKREREKLDSLLELCNPKTVVICADLICTKRRCILQTIQIQIDKGFTFVLRRLQCPIWSRCMDYTDLSMFINNNKNARYSFCGKGQYTPLTEKEYNAWVNKY